MKIIIKIKFRMKHQFRKFQKKLKILKNKFNKKIQNQTKINRNQKGKIILK